MRLVVLGLPAAGKGTQAKLLSERYGVPHISTGSMFRSAIHSNSVVGAKARQYIDRGELVPDEIAAEIVKARITEADCERGFILDGFPRTVSQAKSLDDGLRSLRMHLDAAINIQISEAEAVRRIANRKVCGQCGSTAPPGASSCEDCGGPLVQRPDDRPEVARNRLVVYLAQTQPVVDYYRARGYLVPVNGLQPIPEVFAQTCRRLARMGVKLALEQWDEGGGDAPGGRAGAAILSGATR